jgi:hypothetical protein
MAKEYVLDVLERMTGNVRLRLKTGEEYIVEPLGLTFDNKSRPAYSVLMVKGDAKNPRGGTYVVSAHQIKSVEPVEVARA